MGFNLRHALDMTHECIRCIFNDTEHNISPILSRLWRARCEDIGLAQVTFCQDMNINKSNFSRWLVGKKISHISREKVVQFLSNLDEIMMHFESNDCQCHLSNEFIVSEYLQTSYKTLSIYIRDISQVIEMRHHIQSLNLDELIFIDGDNCSKVSIGAIIDNANAQCAILIFCNPSGLGRMRLVEYVNDIPVFVIITLGCSKNAGDVLLAMHATYFDFTLSLNIPFRIISNDGFAKELCLQLEAGQRQCILNTE
jgi:hypothetical protein